MAASLPVDGGDDYLRRIGKCVDAYMRRQGLRTPMQSVCIFNPNLEGQHWATVTASKLQSPPTTTNTLPPPPTLVGTLRRRNSEDAAFLTSLNGGDDAADRSTSAVARYEFRQRQLNQSSAISRDDHTSEQQGRQINSYSYPPCYVGPAPLHDPLERLRIGDDERQLPPPPVLLTAVVQSYDGSPTGLGSNSPARRRPVVLAPPSVYASGDPQFYADYGFSDPPQRPATQQISGPLPGRQRVPYVTYDYAEPSSAGEGSLLLVAPSRSDPSRPYSMPEPRHRGLPWTPVSAVTPLLSVKGESAIAACQHGRNHPTPAANRRLPFGEAHFGDDADAPSSYHACQENVPRGQQPPLSFRHPSTTPLPLYADDSYWRVQSTSPPRRHALHESAEPTDDVRHPPPHLAAVASRPIPTPPFLGHLGGRSEEEGRFDEPDDGGKGPHWPIRHDDGSHVGGNFPFLFGAVVEQTRAEEQEARLRREAHAL